MAEKWIKCGLEWSTAMTEVSLFRNVPEQDYLSLFPAGSPAGRPDFAKVVRILDLKKRDVARAANISVHSVRYDARVPPELVDRMREWAVALNLVAQFFGDPVRAIIWFKTPNPMLGDVAPRDMIRLGRFKKLYRFILTALDENKQSSAA